jgi:hypothetical protein
MPHILSFMTRLIVEPTVLFTYKWAYTPQSMCKTIPVSQAPVEVHQGNSTMQYMQCVLCVIPVIEFPCKFDTKKGRKRGKAELVSNGNNQGIIELLWSNIKYARTNSNTNIDEILKQTKTPINLFELNTFDKVELAQYKQLSQLLKWMYRNDTSEIVLDNQKNIQSNYIPVTLDIDELENLDIEERNIVRIEKDDKEKKVEPTKYPEPFVWSNKDRNENLKDISEYIGFVLMPKKEAIPNFNNYETYVIEYANMQPTQMIPQASDEIYSLPQIVIVDSSSWNAFTFKTASFIRVKDAWAMLIEAWKDTDRGGMFKTYYNKFYSTEMPLILAEFKSIEQKKMQPLGINNFQDVENLINTQKTKINTLALEQRNLDDEQVFEELVQEVVRRIEALNSEEIRLGSSISARVASFANPNTDYLGNNMLSLFVAKDEEQEKEVKKKVAKQVEKLQEEVVVEETTDGHLKEQTKEFIAQLKPALKFYKGAEKKEFKEYIQSMEAFLTTFD